MNCKLFISLAACFFYLGLHSAAAQQKDTLHLYNNSVLSGELKNIKLGRMTFDADDVGLVNIKLEKIKSIKAVSKKFRIETVGRQIYYGNLLPPSTPGEIAIVTDTGAVLLRIEAVSQLSYYTKGLFQQLEGNVSVGYNYTRSSELGRFNVDGTLSFFGKRTEVNLTASTITSFVGDSTSRDRENVGLQGFYYFHPKWFAAAMASYQRNISLGISRRFQEGLAIGNKFLLRPHMRAHAVTGIVLNQERSIDGDESKVLAEIPLLLQYDLFLFSDPKISLSSSQSVFFGVTQAGRIRQDGETKLSWEIFKDFTVDLIFYNNFDNQPPAADSRKFDYSIVFGIGYEF